VIEGLCLAKAFIKVSSDPIKGTDQPMTGFWLRVEQEYYGFLLDNEARMLEKGEITEPFPRRTHQSLKSQWSGRFQPAVQKFHGICKTIKRTSGETKDETYYQNRVEIYEQRVAAMGSKTKLPRRFDKLLPMYEFLLGQPKFSGHMDPDTGKCTDSDTLIFKQVDGAPKFKDRPRPGGRDNARKKNVIKAASTQVYNAILNNLNESEYLW
jgi:hypothetical protein